MRNVGLMMVKNEVDIIEEVMNEHIKYFDKILVLDGSNDGTGEIIKKFKEVVFYITDKETGYNNIRDGARKILLEKAQELYGYDGWFTLLHGDEIFHDNPNSILEVADQEKSEMVKWESYTFFLHNEDKGEIEYFGSIQKNLQWYTKGWIEFRQFKNKKGIYYLEDQHSYVLPQNINHHNACSIIPIYKHYPYRNPKQMKDRANDRYSRKFQTNYKWIVDASKEDDLYVDQLNLWKNPITKKWK